MRHLTPPGPGGVAVVVAEGDRERAAVVARLRSPGGGAVALREGAPPRLCLLCLPRPGDAAADEVVDEVLVVDRGARGLELHLHASPVVLAAVAAAFGPFRETAPGAAERLLRAALSPAQLALALEQRDVDFAAFVRDVEALPPVAAAREFAAALRRSRTALALARPHRLALVGRQNAGKSTLFNRLLLRERVLTGPHPGLTRDAVTETTCLSGYPYELTDSAGEGPAPAAIDRLAQDQARRLRAGSDWLLIVDGSVGPDAIDRCLWRSPVPVIATKADLPAAPWPGDLPRDLAIDGRDEASAPAVRGAVGELLRRRRELPPAGPVGGPAALDDEQLVALQAAASRAGVAPA